MKRETLEAIRNFQNERKANAQDPVVYLPDGKYEGGVEGFPGLISREFAAAEEMDFVMPRWEDFSTDPARPDKVWLYIKPDDEIDFGEPFLSFSVSSPPATGILGNIDLARRAPGIHRVKYKVEVTNLGNISESDPQLLIVDLTPPYDGLPGPIPAPVPPADLPPSVDISYFQSQTDQSAWFTIPDYVAHGRAPGNRLQLYYGNSDYPYPPVAGNPETFWLLDADLKFPLPLVVVQALGDGLQSLRYEIYDAAGNPSRRSAKFDLDIGLSPAPTDFQLPIIDHAVPGDKLIDRADVVKEDGMRVRIPEYQNFQRGADGDEIIVTLTTSVGAQTLPAQALGDNAFPVEVHTGYSTLEDLYGATVGLLQLTVSYVIKRRSVTYPSGLTTDTDLDLFVVGPTPTDPTDPVNHDLLPVVVRGTDAGGIEGPDNELNPEHATRPANARITLWSAAPTPDARPFTIYLWYDGKPVSQQLVTNGSAGQVIDMEIPWSLIAEQANGTKLVHYTIGTADSTNRQFSPDTSVDVTANVKSMVAPQVLNLSGSSAKFINCLSFDPVTPPGAIEVHIPTSEYFTLGMIVTLYWQGYSDDAGTIPVIDTGTELDSVPLTQPMIYNGFTMRLGPYEEIYKPIQPTRDDRTSGSARLYYSIVLPGDELVNSAEAVEMVRGQKAGSGSTVFCDNTPVPES
ncbi:hypothetical protein [Pseudomonas mucidolens]|uniref:Uncharacterized protein n=1 Tax=Pseudomonas mucidolens TaxID=46679 RepID=A0A1H2MNE8_9PSED|nr:hypothetical protein [Pseudomonas mucidolens]SDU94006.1 hypothetical protein SAMN05216202_1952 [Pseudomonas mucidolens]SQH33643.1 Uncharacterised protein [Pseudomonas mucidolens]